MTTPAPDLTRCLRDAADGVDGAAERLLPLVYDELRMLARRQLRGERPDHSLQPTALVHEMWLRLRPDDAQAFEHRRQFFAAAACSMRRILVEHARARKAHKRGGGRGDESEARTPTTLLGAETFDPDQVLDVDAALTDLEARAPRQAQLVLLKYFGGLSNEEIAAALDVSIGTVERDWRLARARLARRLGPG